MKKRKKSDIDLSSSHKTKEMRLKTAKLASKLRKSGDGPNVP